MNLERLYKNKAEFFNQSDDEILAFITSNFGVNILEDISTSITDHFKSDNLDVFDGNNDLNGFCIYCDSENYTLAA